MRVKRKLSTAGRLVAMGENDFEIRMRQEAGDALGPFDQANGVGAEVIGEPCGFPFGRIVETIKIKVIEV
jgi:hypothetical protein